MVIGGLALALLAAIFDSFLAFEPGEIGAGYIVGGLFIGFAALVVTGEAFCLTIPRDVGGRWCVALTLILQGVYVGFYLASDQLLEDRSWLLGRLIRFTGLACFFAAFAFFTWFMFRVGARLGNSGITRRARDTLIGGGMGAISMLSSLTYAAFQEQLPTFPMPAAIGMAVGGLLLLIALVMYANTVTYLRRAIVV